MHTGTGIEVNELNQQISIYPNPSQGIFSVKWIEAPTEHSSMAVFTPLGQEVLRLDQVTDQQVEINLETFPDGLYVIRIFTHNQAGSFLVNKSNRLPQ
jgi:hypothetical protein